MTPTNTKLSESLKDWEDQDVAAFKIGCALGVFPEDNNFREFTKYKPQILTRGKLSDLLFDVMHALVDQGVLLMNEVNEETGEFDPDGFTKVRFNSDYEPEPYRRSQT